MRLGDPFCTPPAVRRMDDPQATEADTLRRHAEERPRHIALIFNERTSSYEEMNAFSNKVANGLISLQPDRQQRIALLTKNSDQYFQVIFGIAKAAKVALPLNWRLSPRELAVILNDADPKILFLDPVFLSVLPELEGYGVKFEHVIAFDASPGGQGFSSWRDSQASADPCLAVAPDDVFLQMYTSGTTGVPKGVQISHGSSMRMRKLEVGDHEPWTDWGPHDIALVNGPNFHISGTNWALQWFARGSTCVVQPQVDPAAILDAIERHRVTRLFAVPTVLSMLLEDESCGRRDLSTLKMIQYGGAPIVPALLRRCIDMFKCDVVQLYGMTETNGVVCRLQPQDHDLERPELLKSCGQPYPDVDLRIMDGEGREVPAGVVGEVCIKTPCLMSGYWKLPKATAESMFGAYYRSGDAGYFNGEGYLFLVDRVKDMIVSGGENIYPIEIERILCEHPAVKEAAVIGVPDPHWGERVKAVLVVSAPVRENELTEFLEGKIARYKMPRIFEFVSALPKNAGGKVLKRELRATAHKIS